jgi:hypothetical protein
MRKFIVAKRNLHSARKGGLASKPMPRRAESGLSGLQISEVEDDAAEAVERKSGDPVPIA